MATGVLVGLAGLIAAHADQVINDDLSVNGLACVGFNCVDGETFGLDTLRLKENNVAIHFDDTSTTAGDPANDWRIQINDVDSGSNNFFAVVDATSGTTLMRLCAVNDPGCTNLMRFGGAFTAATNAVLAQMAAHQIAVGVNQSAISTNRSAIATNSARIADLHNSLGSLEYRTEKLNSRSEKNTEGIAVALATGGSAQALVGQKVAFSLTYGHFEGAHALAIGGNGRLAKNVSVDMGIGIGLTKGNTGGRAAIRVNW